MMFQTYGDEIVVPLNIPTKSGLHETDIFSLLNGVYGFDPSS